NKEKIETDGDYAICRCGQSKNQPFCDGSHISAKFNGTEIASKKITDKDILKVETEKLELIDIPVLCDHSRFCTRAGGIRKLLKESDDNPKSEEIAKDEATKCTSGRLTIIDKNTGETTEPDLKKEIVILYDTGKQTEASMWVKGGISIESADGTPYEIRNRMTFCRCGKSDNKPFCDGTHWADEEFQNKFRKRWNLD
ncbi:CDGSH iron-sulfur domain-containing protein, partial [Methanobrevibacter sp. OttesenSCG-928-I08]|nr:CDGSH iron-sulfur domain-containing protein [Methanobrevibacter sp. OttesenSCG-928-I08]